MAGKTKAKSKADKPERVIRLKKETKESKALRVKEYFDARAQGTKRRIKSIRKRVWFTIVAMSIVLFFVFGFTSRFIFGKDAWITKVAEESIADVINIVKVFEGSLPVILHSLSVLFLGLVIIWLVSMCLATLAVGSNRRKTVLGLVASFVKYIGALVILTVLLGVWGVNTVALVAGIGILGLIVGLGAQNLIGDILAGLFIVFENNFQVGDIVTVDDFRGEVMEIGLRTTRIKSPVGDVKVINNSSIRTIINMSRLPSFALVDITIDYSENLERVEQLIDSALFGFAQRLPAITNEPEYLGVCEFSSRGVVMRFKAECEEVNRLQLTRDLNRELKLLFDRNKIKIAVEQVEVTK